MIYATMAAINDSIQLVSVRPALTSGESGGLAMFPQENPKDIGGSRVGAE